MTGRGDFARVARETLDYLAARDDRARRRLLLGDRRRLGGPDGVSAEGKFFVWSKRGDRSVLGARRRRRAFRRALRRDRRRQLRGREHPARRRVPTRPNGRRWPTRGRRSTRCAPHAPPPLRDEKILAAWNGLAISGFAVAGRVLDEPRYVAAARARRRLRARPDAPGRTAGAQLARTAAPARGVPRRLRFLDGRAARSLRGDVRAAAGWRRRWRSPTRPSGVRRSGAAAGS